MVVLSHYLQAYAAVAKDYEQLKLSLWKLFEHNRDAYTAHKGDFVRHYTELAKQLLTEKYDIM